MISTPIQNDLLCTLQVNTSLLADFGISKGDFVSVSRTVCDYNGKLVVLNFDGKLVIRKAVMKANRVTFFGGNVSPMEFHLSEINIYGWIQYIIHPV